MARRAPVIWRSAAHPAGSNLSPTLDHQDRHRDRSIGAGSTGSLAARDRAGESGRPPTTPRTGRDAGRVAPYAARRPRVGGVGQIEEQCRHGRPACRPGWRRTRRGRWCAGSSGSSPPPQMATAPLRTGSTGASEVRSTSRLTAPSVADEMGRGDAERRTEPGDVRIRMPRPSVKSIPWPPTRQTSMSGASTRYRSASAGITRSQAVSASRRTRRRAATPPARRPRPPDSGW